MARDDGYLSAWGPRRISKGNRKITAKLEKTRIRWNVPESEYMTEMENPANAVEFENLHTLFSTDVGTVKSADSVSFEVSFGEAVGVVGESGCGKSVTSLSLMQFLQCPQGQVVGGSIRLNIGDKVYEITRIPENVTQHLRGNLISITLQKPMTSSNPVFRIGDQMDEVTMFHKKSEYPAKEAVKGRMIELLRIVDIVNSEGTYNMYPYEFSGGMRQRVMIAMALTCSPKLIIADEPTIALGVTIQAQILDLFRGLKDKINSSIMPTTHDLGVVAEMVDYVVVMYSGRVVGAGTAKETFSNPAYSYTIGLMVLKPIVGKYQDKPYSIPGKVPSPINMLNYCYFRDRCNKREGCCDGVYPGEIWLSETHWVSCYRYDETHMGSGQSKAWEETRKRWKTSERRY